jgi:hypothetical protein
MDRCEEDWYASGNNLLGTLRDSRKKPKAGRQSTGCLSTAVLCRDLEKNGIVRAWHGRGMANVNKTRPHCVNQMGKTQSKPLAARHGRGTAWALHAICESAFSVLALLNKEGGFKSPRTCNNVWQSLEYSLVPSVRHSKLRATLIP